MRSAAIALVPGLALALGWLRLEEPPRPAARVLLLVALAVLPAAAPRLRWRLATLTVSGIAAVVAATGVPVRHLLRAAHPVGQGVLDYYDVRLPFRAAFHPEMHTVTLLAVFAFAAAVALAVASRRPLAAVAVFVVGAGWPATLLSDDHDLARGALILMIALFLLAAVRVEAGRTLVLAFVLAAALVAAALAATTQPAIAKSEFLHWQTWDPYTRAVPAVRVNYVWDSNYDGIDFPEKKTVVLKVHAPERSVYWRAATLDYFDGRRWVESRSLADATFANGRLELTQSDPLAAGSRNRTSWRRAEFEIAALADSHVVAPGVPVAYDMSLAGSTFSAGGTALKPGGLERGNRYDAWGYAPQLTPKRVARSRATYPDAVLPYLEVYPGLNPPPAFGTPRRAEILQRFLGVYGDYRGLVAEARRVTASARSPYGAALGIESWLRSTGGFVYTTHPKQSPRPLLDFVTRTKQGYCQHFAGAMALMLRYLGVPARVAAGFVSGTYDAKTKTWTVTDHDAHAWVEAWFAGYGWLAFDPTPGRGYLSAPYSVSSPAFRPASASSIVRGIAAARDVPGATDAPGVRFGGTDIRHPPPESVPRVSGGGALARRGGSLGKLLVLVVLLVVALLAVAKAVRRHLRYATPDPRRQAAACRAEVRDFLADQGVHVPPSATLAELERILERYAGVQGGAFVEALQAARFGPPDQASAAAARARGELARLRTLLRRNTGLGRRARGLLSLRSFGYQ
jgi:transglutaminase-like putative cysteine protease